MWNANHFPRRGCAVAWQAGSWLMAKRGRKRGTNMLCYPSWIHSRPLKFARGWRYRGGLINKEFDHFS
jgi:hypothetical protein